MKTLAAIVLFAATLSAGAQYTNTITGELASVLPNPLWLDGWKSPPSAEDYAAAGWVALTAEQIAAAAQAAQVQAARIGQLATQFGPMVGALQVFLSKVGYSIPVDPATVTGDLLTRAIAGTLTAEQREAKANIADLYIYLQAAGLSNADIAAVWEAIKP